MKKIIVLSLMLFLLQSNIKSLANDSLEYKKISLESEEMFFVFFKHANEEIQNRINYSIQISELGYLLDDDDYIIKAGNLDEKSRMNYDITHNNNGFLSLYIDNTYSGDFTFMHRQGYNFNTLTGEEFTLKEIFTEDGFKKFMELNIPRRINHYIDMQIDLDFIIDTSYSEREAVMKEHEILPFFIEDDSLFIDDLAYLPSSLTIMWGGMTTGFSLKEIEPMLNPFGKAITSGDTTFLKNYSTINPPYLYKGKIEDEIEIMTKIDNGTKYGNILDFVSVDRNISYSAYRNDKNPSGDILYSLNVEDFGELHFHFDKLDKNAAEGYIQENDEEERKYFSLTKY